jgi:hypothetical protein
MSHRCVETSRGRYDLMLGTKSLWFERNFFPLPTELSSLLRMLQPFTIIKDIGERRLEN